MLAEPQNVPFGIVVHDLDEMAQSIQSFVPRLNLLRRQRFQNFIFGTGMQVLCSAVLFTKVDLQRPHIPCIMSTLLANGAVVNCRRQGITPLMTAIAVALACDAHAKILFLLNKGANPALECRHGYTPLYYTLECFRVDTLLMFVNNGPPDTDDDDTPRTMESMDIVQYLLNAMFPLSSDRLLRLSYFNTTGCCHIASIALSHPYWYIKSALSSR